MKNGIFDRYLARFEGTWQKNWGGGWTKVGKEGKS